MQTVNLRTDTELPKRQVDIGPFSPELSNGLRDDRTGSGLEKPNGDGPDSAGRSPLRRPGPELGVGDGPLCVLAESQAGRGQPYLTAVAVKESSSDRRLEALNLLADCGLCDPDATSSAAEVELFGHSQEITQMAKLEIHK